jgi:hypothetical protein
VYIWFSNLHEIEKPVIWLDIPPKSLPAQFNVIGLLLSGFKYLGPENEATGLHFV